MPTCPTCRERYPDDVSACPKDGAALLPDVAFAAADTDLKPGDVVGEYRVEGKLGEGGFGAVFRAVHPLIGKWAAIKVLHREFSANPQMVSRFIAEARAVNQIRHRHIIDIFSFGALPDGRQYYVMELLEGMTFDAFLAQRGRLAPEEAIPILRGVARALDAAHKAGIAHRDLKPENIFLVFDQDGGIEPKLLDFGIAKLTQDDGRVKTRTGTPMGTPYYMSPEQARGQNVDFRTDVYAFGVMCHQILTGKMPFDGESVMDIFLKHAVSPPPRLSEHEPSLRSELDGAVLRMLAKDPAERPASVGVALDELQNAAHGAGYALPPVGLGAAAALSASRPSFDALPKGALSISSAQPKKLTPDELALASAQTVVGVAPAGSAAPPGAAPRPSRRRGVVLAAVGLVAMLGIVGVSAVALRGAPPEAPVARAAPTPPERAGGRDKADRASTKGRDRTNPPGSAAPGADGPSDEPSPPPEPNASGEAAPSPSAAKEKDAVLVTVDTNVPGAAVYAGSKLLGAAPGPVLLPHGTAPVVLTIKAQGYKPATVSVVPREPTHVGVTLDKRPVAAPSSKVQNKDLENPF